ncbi:MAG: hypothetical protein JNM66_15010 [Bryobacterales bacterium]|nr:hypothetical protein [Bryobacterales bacterium]
MFLPTYDIATDRWRGPMSEMLLYTEHPFLPIHAALFSNFDGTMSVVVSGRDGRDCSDAYTVSLAGGSLESASAMEIVVRPSETNQPGDRVTFEDTGSQFTGIRFEVKAEPAVAS